MSKAEKKNQSATIAVNRRAKFDYFIEKRLEAGIVLQGWEVKAIREGKANLTDSYVIFKNGEAFLLGAQVIPLNTVSTHFVPDPTATRKLLLNKTEIAKLSAEVAQKGYTLLALSLYWKSNRVKVELGLAKGKAEHDKRDTTKEREWQREKERTMKHKVR
ncbi:SsrA-binding protein SmpB [Permianibacter aggregans]|uniref:SsrA-binding protein n=1 Tax=Permianibacter aggregans TaxID=1510150 RepID=A0A4R6UQV1_9GAMM|nr:SsrA-binding protein SmpB [Permianibacter aggregans]QGX39142.1 SsrA-binding protein SmpB [Permianibacter aggregans]TDQ47645.1 SsrA-binding protein [Permianibacter aggregans]